MKYAILAATGTVSILYGPFDTKQEAKKWAEELEEESYAIVALYPPYAR